MEKYKYCSIGPASSPRVGGREGGKGLCMIDIRFEESVGRKGTDFFFIVSERGGKFENGPSIRIQVFPLILSSLALHLSFSQLRAFHLHFSSLVFYR